MLKSLINKVVGSSNERALKKLWPFVHKVNALEERFDAMSDEELQGMTQEFRRRLNEGENIDDIVAEAFAVIRSAAQRVLGMRPYDVQVLGGYAIHLGKIAEMKTGEGKTLTATMPVYTNALSGEGAHVVTVNDYLASRDAEWMGQIYRFMGLSVGVIVHGMSDTARQEAYQSDVTYGQNNEFGFDYLRDNLKFRLEDYVQRPHHFAIVDEVDSILIDEARTPLIISGPADESSKLYYKINALIPFLKVDADYVVDEKSMAVSLTDIGVDKVEQRLSLTNLFDPENVEFLHHVNTALRAHMLFKRDQHYLIEGDEIIIVDEFTGRKMPGRRWSHGLHQAVEAKEGLKVQQENQTLATVTFQNYFRMYDKLSGMTGTADTEAEEFHKIYELDVIVVPTNRPLARLDEDDYIYVNERAKYRAIIEDIRDCHERGQPVLVGTTSVSRNEFLSQILTKEDIEHQVLNAKQHGTEAGIVAQAGSPGAVTIATNMAGRGTDIVLGGNPELEAARMSGVDEGPEYDAALEKAKLECEARRAHILSAGGLRVIGTERHDSRRIDNQLRGRAGRQGDSGATRFYLSLDDDLLRIFGGENLKKWMTRFKLPEDEPIYHRWVTRVIESSQRKVEARNFDQRKNLLEYDDVMNQQRTTIYALRRQVLEGREVHEWVLEASKDVGYGIADQFCPEGTLPDEYDLEGLSAHAHNEWGMDLDFEGVDTGKFSDIGEHLAGSLAEHYDARAKKIANQLWEVHKAETGATQEQYWERWVEYEQEQLLRSVDRNWKLHLQALDHLREGVFLEAYGQRDPKLIYKKEAFEYFHNLLREIRESVVGTLFRVEIRSDEQIERLKREREDQARRQAEKQKLSHAEAQSLSSDAAQAARGAAAQGQTAQAAPSTVQRTQPKVGRNDPCPCGSGKKYKKCCLPKHQAA
jgi:preprotein translocase subunit SecA